MSATIMWRRVEPEKNRVIEVAGPSAFVAAMNRAFGEAPWQLDRSHLAVLRGMAAAFGDRRENPYEEVAALTDECGAIDVWAEW